MQKGNGKASTGHKVVTCLKNYKLVWIRPQTVYFNFSLIHNVPVGETPTGSGKGIFATAPFPYRPPNKKSIAGNNLLCNILAFERYGNRHACLILYKTPHSPSYRDCMDWYYRHRRKPARSGGCLWGSAHQNARVPARCALRGFLPSACRQQIF